MFVLVENVAEAIASSYVEAVYLAGSAIGVGNGYSGRVFAMP
jgi:hypothetical protein